MPGTFSDGPSTLGQRRDDSEHENRSVDPSSHPGGEDVEKDLEESADQQVTLVDLRVLVVSTLRRARLRLEKDLYLRHRSDLNRLLVHGGVQRTIG